MNRIRLIIAGSRTFSESKSLDLIEFAVRELIRERPVQVISGGARGVDAAGEVYAKNNGIEFVRIAPDWSLGRKAGPLRNAQMAKYACNKIGFKAMLLLIWDGESRGSASMLREAEREQIETHQIIIKSHGIGQ